VALIPPGFLDCVVAIGTAAPSDGIEWIASGFFYGLRQEGEPAEYRIYLVTNRHVLDGVDQIYIRANPRAQDEQSREFLLQLLDDDGVPLCHAHPNPEIDVAVAAVNFQVLLDHEMQVAWFQSDEHVQHLASMQELGVTEGDAVFVLGFPMGLLGRDRNVVIVRSGSIARIRDTIAHTEDTFLVDATVFPGNSGGPVLFRPEVLSITGTTAISQAFLMGVVSGYVPYVDVAVSPQTGRARITFEENTGLSAVYAVDYIEETITDWQTLSAEPPETQETAADTR
jgi:Trypsin-like peptidase domain